MVRETLPGVMLQLGGLHRVQAKRPFMPTPGPDQTKLAPRPIVAALIGAEAGAAVGLVVLGGTTFAPLGLAVAGAAAGPLALAGIVRVRRGLVRRGIRQQLRQGHPAPDS
jgi:hypothetical protein